MKALIQKELRENLPLAVVGVMVFGLLLLAPYLAYTFLMNEVVAGRTAPGADLDHLLPLHSSFFLMSSAMFCGIFGAILGWLQLYHERQADLWAFLVHRPMSATGLFLGKTLAGLGLYALVAGLPLLGLTLWAALPGHLAAPFEPNELWPILGAFLQGILFYFAGLLTGLRRARWYASRGLGLGLALWASLMLLNSPSPSVGLGVYLLALFILATAVWGGFHSHGHYEGQPRLAKPALSVALLGGTVLVTSLVAGLILNWLSPWMQRFDSPATWSNYVMSQDGNLYRNVHSPYGPGRILDLNDRPFLDPKTGQPLDPARFNRYVCHAGASLDFEPRPARRRGFFDTTHYFSFWRETPDTLWFFWPRYGRLVGYDIATRRRIGSLGPDGFSQEVHGTGERIQPVWRTLWSPTALCLVDLDRRTTRPLFTTTEDDPIGAVQEIHSPEGDWNYTFVATRRFLHLLSSTGDVVWKLPYEPSYATHPHLNVSILDPPGQFAVWFNPSYQAGRSPGPRPPIHVVWINHDQGVFKQLTLSNLDPAPRELSASERCMNLVLPPISMPLFALLFPTAELVPFPWRSMGIGLAVAALLWVPLGWWLANRFRSPLSSRLGWALFHLLFGLPGFLAFLSVQEWPAREPCPQCRRLRVVDREQCEHCGAMFPPPEKTGLEIFEPAGAQ